MTDSTKPEPSDRAATHRIGVWEAEEHSRFLRGSPRGYVGVVRHGKDWRQVREVIGSRQEKQIQSHHQKYLRRVSKMVKKIKRKGGSHSYEDGELEAEVALYRLLFTTADLTSLTPCQIRSMILCVCPGDHSSPRKQRNIIITDSKSDHECPQPAQLPLIYCSQLAALEPQTAQP
jgi:hypothetical protein